MTATDTTTVPDVDLTRDVPCDMKGCGNTATWLARQSCCGLDGGPQCGEHRAVILDYLASLPFATCIDCKAFHDNPTDYFTWWPL